MPWSGRPPAPRTEARQHVATTNDEHRPNNALHPTGALARWERRRGERSTLDGPKRRGRECAELSRAARLDGTLGPCGRLSYKWSSAIAPEAPVPPEGRASMSDVQAQMENDTIVQAQSETPAVRTPSDRGRCGRYAVLPVVRPEQNGPRDEVVAKVTRWSRGRVHGSSWSSQSTFRRRQSPEC